MIKKLISLLLFMSVLPNTLFAKPEYLQEGIDLFNKKKFEDARFKFEKDIVFNPKSENSYLYLAKIFKVEENYNLEENNLNTVLLLNPRNEEAIYLLTLLNIKNSNFSEAKKLMISFNSVCKKICSSKLELQSKLDSSLKSE